MSGWIDGWISIDRSIEILVIFKFLPLRRVFIVVISTFEKRDWQQPGVGSNLMLAAIGCFGCGVLK
jgi:hypothetical protein